MRTRFEVQVVTDPEYLEEGLVARVWDHQRQRPYGWYTSAKDAANAAAFLNASNGCTD